MNDIIAKSKILFISHQASRSGAPLYLFHLIKWLTIKKDINAYLLLVDGGEMEREYNFCKNVWIWNSFHSDSRLKSRLIGKFNQKSKKKIYQKNIFLQIKNAKPDLIIANTVVSLPLLKLFKNELKIRSAAILHEMKFSIDYFYQDSLSKENLDAAEKIITVNNQIRNFIVKDYLVTSDNIVYIPPFINKLPNQSDKQNIITNKITVGMSGYTGWQKGYDLLPQLLSILKERGQIKYFDFVWLGEIESNQYTKNEMQLQNMDLGGYVKHTGKVANIESWLNRFDLFLSLSREDSYPLVCIEAAASGLPVIAFDKSGGVSDFLSLGGGILIPYLNLEKVVEALDVYRNRKRRMIDADFAVKRAQSHDIDIIAERVCSFLKL